MKKHPGQNVKHTVQMFIRLLEVQGENRSATLVQEAMDTWATTSTEKLIQLREALSILEFSDDNHRNELEQHRNKLVQMIDNTLWRSNHPRPWNFIERFRDFWNQMIK